MLRNLIACSFVAAGCGAASAAAPRPAPDPLVIHGRVAKPQFFVVVSRAATDLPLPGADPALAQALADEAKARDDERHWASTSHASPGGPDIVAAIARAHAALLDARQRALALLPATPADPTAALVRGRLMIDDASERLSIAYDAWERQVAHWCEGLAPNDDCAPTPPEPVADLGPAVALLERALDAKPAKAVESRLAYLLAFARGEALAAVDATVADVVRKLYERALRAEPGPLAGELHLRLGMLADDRQDLSGAIAHYDAVDTAPYADMAAAMAIRDAVGLGRCPDAAARAERWRQRAADTQTLGADIAELIAQCGDAP
ncbi:MAG: hypothetical protein U1F43_10375 [Myxococcota bacterium]